MPAFKNGLRSLYRSPLKSVLFLLVLAALVMMLSLGLCIHSAVNTYLSDCDDYYRTVAALEYVGYAYPDSTVYDTDLTARLTAGEPDLQTLSALPGVLDCTENWAALGIIDGFTRTDNAIADRNAAILVVRNLFWNEHTQAYLGTICDNLYSVEDTTNKHVCITSQRLVELAGGEGLLPNTRYIFTGHYTTGQSGYVWFAPEDMVFDGFMLEEFTPLPEDGLNAGSLYDTAAQVLANRNNGTRVQLVDRLADYLPFQQESLTLTSGRLYTPEEAAAGARVCVISDMLAGLLEIQPGDTIPLSLNFPENGIFGSVPAEENEYNLYTVVGIYANTEQYRDWIFLPDRAEFPQALLPTGYEVCQFRLENGRAEEFSSAAQALLPSGFRLTVYDQGYQVTVAPFQELLLLARLFLGVCALVIAAVLCLYGYLLVLRQREQIQTMLALGSGRGYVLGRFAVSALTLGLLACVPGVLGGAALEGRVLDALRQFAEQYQQADLRYSSSALSVILPLSFAPETPRALYVLAAAAITAASTAVCLVFTLFCPIRRQKKRARPVRTPKYTGRSSRMSGVFKYALLSARRGGPRTLAIIALAAAASLFFGQLTATLDTCEEQLQQVRTDTRIRVFASNISGLSMDSLNVSARLLETVYDSGLIRDYSATQTCAHYRFLGISAGADGTRYQLDDPYYPGSDFAVETFLGQMAREPRLVFTSSLAGAPAFYYTAAPTVSWLEGFDETRMTGDAVDEASGLLLAVIPDSLATAQAICPGDTIRLYTDLSAAPTVLDMKVIGIYESSSTEAVIYLPMALEHDEDAIKWLSYSSASFTLTDNTRLDDLRQVLEDAGFTTPGSRGSQRSYLVIDDKDYLSTTSALERQLQYLQLLYGCLYVLTDLIGLIAAFLLLFARKQEFAVMRGLGTQQIRIFLNFVGEQLLLAAAGCAIALCLQDFNPVQLQLIGSFLLCEALGAAITTLHLLHTNTLATLSARE